MTEIRKCLCTSYLQVYDESSCRQSQDVLIYCFPYKLEDPIKGCQGPQCLAFEMNNLTGLYYLHLVKFTFTCFVTLVHN